MRVDNNTEDKLVVSKAQDTIRLSQKRFCPCYYGFLNEHEAQLIKDNLYLDENDIFWGGYIGARRAVFGAGCCDTSDFPIVALTFTYKKEYKLSHRDFLGALMSLGVNRSTIGDIVVNDGSTVVFVKDDVSSYIISEVSKIGRVGVKIEKNEHVEIHSQDEFDELNFTVSSLRLDVFVSSLCSLSREKSQQLIKADMVSLNHNIENNVSKNLKVSDVISIRKYGKYIFAESNGFSKKGKFKITVNHFR